MEMSKASIEKMLNGFIENVTNLISLKSYLGGDWNEQSMITSAREFVQCVKRNAEAKLNKTSQPTEVTGPGSYIRIELKKSLEEEAMSEGIESAIEELEKAQSERKPEKKKIKAESKPEEDEEDEDAGDEEEDLGDEDEMDDEEETESKKKKPMKKGEDTGLDAIDEDKKTKGKKKLKKDFESDYTGASAGNTTLKVTKAKEGDDEEEEEDEDTKGKKKLPPFLKKKMKKSEDEEEETDADEDEDEDNKKGKAGHHMKFGAEDHPETMGKLASHMTKCMYGGMKAEKIDKALYSMGYSKEVVGKAKKHLEGLKKSLDHTGVQLGIYRARFNINNPVRTEAPAENKE